MDAISCLAPAPAPYLTSSSAFTDASIARALHFSMCDSPAASSSSSTPSSLFADFASCGTAGGSWFAPAPAPQPVVITCDSMLVADSGARPSTLAAANKRQLGPAGGRAGKRRARASKRTPTTYISTDPANFRLMVQHVTGVQAEPADGVLPTAFDASALLAAADSTPPFGGYGKALLPDNDAALHHHHHHHQQQQQQPCFPTLDSWSVMYESSSLL